MASIAASLFPTPKSSPFFPSSCSIGSASLHSPVLFRSSFSIRSFNPRFFSSSIRAGFEIPGGFVCGGDVETDELRRDVRDRAMQAIDACGGRVTVGDVVSRGGLKLCEAEKALQALAADTGGFLEVSDEGDVLYVFARDYQSKLAVKSFRIRIEPLLESARGTAGYLIRIFFGSILLASIIIVFATIACMVTSDDDGILPCAFNLDDLFCFCSPNDGKNRITGKRKNMSLLQLLFLSIGQYIASRGGVVTKEELAPYLDVPLTSDSKSQDDESYILPVLLQFGGHPEVDDEGNILYCFLSLQKTAVSERIDYVEKFLREETWKFRAVLLLKALLIGVFYYGYETNDIVKAILIGLGAINLWGVITMSNMLKSVGITAGGLVSSVSGILPLLQVYAALYFVVPIVRWFTLCWRNAEIEHRNNTREKHAQLLERPDLFLRKKMSSAKAMAQRTEIGYDRIVYSTGEDLSPWDPEARDWDLRFKEVDRSFQNK